MKTNIYQEQHQDHAKWLSEISFFADEIKVFKKRLEELAQANTGKDIMANIEHFQNQFIIQKENLDILKHEIMLGEKKVEAGFDKKHNASDHKKGAVHGNEKEHIESFEKVFTELKNDFDKFLAQHL